MRKHHNQPVSKVQRKSSRFYNEYQRGVYKAQDSMRLKPSMKAALRKLNDSLSIESVMKTIGRVQQKRG